MENYYMGIDVSKGYADFVILDAKKDVVEPNFQLDDTFGSHCKLFEILKRFFDRHSGSVLFAAVESTGGYENNWLHSLGDFQGTLDIRSARLNPLGVRANSKASLRRVITDKISARDVAEYLIAHPEKVTYQQEDSLAGLRRQWGFVRLLVKQKTQILNQFESLLYTANPELIAYCQSGVPAWLLKLLKRYPTAVKLAKARATSVARIPYVTADRAKELIEQAKNGKGGDALDPFWKKLKRSRAKVKAVAMDMSPAYISAVLKHLPKATIVFDHFHVIKLFNDKLSDLRRDLYRETKENLHKEVLKGTRWLLLKNPANLDTEKREKERLEDALKLNEPLACAYYLKEDLRQIWLQPNKETAERVFADWVKRAQSTSIKMLKKFADTLAGYKSGILAYYDYRISSGPMEGTNNKIKTMKRMAYGFRDMEFFKLKIMALHETKYALVG